MDNYTVQLRVHCELATAIELADKIAQIADSLIPGLDVDTIVCTDSGDEID